ncbi:F-box protein [Acorus gramineus]|uniref:F-box protein n=1 Tax=Acorus gramineus TaxID=55184 RepID=A0AAV8ZW87_ACOGR|nr:F-box protein [Acorus gramineus]
MQSPMSSSSSSSAFDLHHLSMPDFDDHFDRLPDPLLLTVFNRIGDVKSLGRCSAVSRRFHSLAFLSDDLLLRVDPSSDHHSPSPSPPVDKPRGGGAGLFSLLLHLLRPLHHLLCKKPSPTAADSAADAVNHHSPREVLKGFTDLRRLRIELPEGELGVDDGALLRWRARFGSTLDRCVIFAASSVEPPSIRQPGSPEEPSPGGDGESFYMDGSLKLRVVWTISTLIAASARHYLLRPIVEDHLTLETLVLADADRQGILSMGRAQMDDLRARPVVDAPKGEGTDQPHRTVVPALDMRLWYAPRLELPGGGPVLIGATLIAIWPAGRPAEEVDEPAKWVTESFREEEEEPVGLAARILAKRKSYCLEMNSF